MSGITEIADISGRWREARIIGLVSSAHFVSHVYILLLPPLFAFIMRDYPVGYAGLGLAIAAFNIVSTLVQTPAGFAVDRLGARALLILALVIGASAVAFAAIMPFYWALVAGFGLAGIANTIYHPADYAILSHSIGPKRLGQAYSLHTFSGMLGGAAAPASMLLLASFWGWRGALLGAAVLGYAVALVLLVQRNALPEDTRPQPTARPTAAAPPTDTGWRLLASGPVLRSVIFFILLSMASGGISNFSIVALGALYGTPQPVANLALTIFLLMSAAGVLAGGIIADRARNHGLVAAVGFAASGLAILLVGLVPLGTAALMFMMALAGLLNGGIMPSRDMIVRAVTPPGAFGTVFGFVSTGFSVAGVLAPLLFGWLMDQGHPRAIFLMVVTFTLLALPLISIKPARARTA